MSNDESSNQQNTMPIKVAVRPLGKKHFIVSIGCIVIDAFLIWGSITIIDYSYDYQPLGVFLLLFALFYSIMLVASSMAKIVFEDKVIRMTKGFLRVGVLEEDTDNKYRYIVIDEPVIEYKGIVSVEYRTVLNMEKRHYEFENDKSCIELLDNNNHSFRILTDMFGRKQVKFILAEIKKRTNLEE